MKKDIVWLKYQMPKSTRKAKPVISIEDRGDIKDEPRI